MQFGFAEIVNL